jgi:threonylcarbamoyladenosine tRNA methylthiotransferase MtaB
MRYHKYVPGYYVENFGCRATQADGAALERQFEDQGLTRAANPAQASVVVLNTCTVTAAADQDARAAIRRVRRQNPTASIVVTGCYAQRAPEEIAKLPGVSLVVGNSHKHKLAEIALEQYSPSSPNPVIPNTGKAWVRNPLLLDGLENYADIEPSIPSLIPITALTDNSQLATGDRIFVSDIFAHTELLAAPVFDAANERTRPNLKIQDGCDNRCSFCVIPYVRGQSRSLEIDRILAEVNALVDSGYQEVVLSGINLGRWGRDLRKPEAERRKPEFGERFEKTSENLIRIILSETTIAKLRISSVEPMDWSDDLIELVASEPRIAKHAHVPMQSGSDAVLRRMHRKYRPWHYREKIEKIRAAMPTAAIGADVMVGFPGETDAEFEATHRLVEDLPFTYLHVFTYSARPGTPAASMPNQVPVHIARERNRILRELASKKKLAFMCSFVGKTVDAITLNITGHDENGQFTEALTDNFLKLRLHGHHRPNEWRFVNVNEVRDGALAGKIEGRLGDVPEQRSELQPRSGARMQPIAR